MSGAGVGHVLHVAGILFIQFPAAHVFGEQTFVRIGKRRRVLFHRPCGDSGVDALGRHLFDSGLGRSMLHRRDAVTFCTAVLEQIDAGAFGQPLRKQARRGQQDQRQESTRDSIENAHDLRSSEIFRESISSVADCQTYYAVLFRFDSHASTHDSCNRMHSESA